MGFGGVGLPTAGELSRRLVGECLRRGHKYPGADHEDFLRICQYFEVMTGSPRSLRRWIKEQLTVDGLLPSKLHLLLATLPISFVLTTNFDYLMEVAFVHTGKKPNVSVFDIWSRALSPAPPGSIDNPVVYKLHGTLADERTMICTEDDIIEFSARLLQSDPGLPPAIRELFETSSILFIGYGLRDWNVRVMLRALRARRGNRGVDWSDSFAIQRRTDDWDSVVLYFSKKENIKCFDVDALQFVDELCRRLKANEVIHV
jgi:hypothetical protein